MTRTITPSAPGSVPARQAVAARQLRHPAGRSTRSTYKRLMRRETRPLRTVVAVSLASVIIAGCLYSGTELILELTGRAPLIIAPSDAVRTVSQVNQVAPAILFSFGLLAAVAGLVLVLVALLPGRLARHEVALDRAVVIVRDGLADAPAAGTGAAGRTAPQTGGVTGGVPARFTAAKAIAEAIAYDALRPALEPTVVVTKAGRVDT